MPAFDGAAPNSLRKSQAVLMHFHPIQFQIPKPKICAKTNRIMKIAKIVPFEMAGILEVGGAGASNDL